MNMNRGIMAIAPERLSEAVRAMEAAIAFRESGREIPKSAAEQGGSVSGVGIVRVMGVMVRRADAIDEWFGMAGTDKIREKIEDAAANPNVSTIVMLIDSPGGEVDGLAELADSVRAAAGRKRVIAQVEGMAASAAYMTASQATEIVAGRMDMIGSIGTRLTLFDTSKMAERWGIKAIPIDTGEFKSTGEFGTPITEAQIEYIRGLVDGYFADFKATVMRGRKMDAAAFAKVSDGRVWLAEDAKKLGLIDGFSTIRGTISRLQAAKGFASLNRSRRDRFEAGLAKI
jgi:signal peptide peptidase SppA